MYRTKSKLFLLAFAPLTATPLSAQGAPNVRPPCKTESVWVYLDKDKDDFAASLKQISVCADDTLPASYYRVDPTAKLPKNLIYKKRGDIAGANLAVPDCSDSDASKQVEFIANSQDADGDTLRVNISPKKFCVAYDLQYFDLSKSLGSVLRDSYPVNGIRYSRYRADGANLDCNDKDPTLKAVKKVNAKADLKKNVYVKIAETTKCLKEGDASFTYLDWKDPKLDKSVVKRGAVAAAPTVAPVNPDKGAIESPTQDDACLEEEVEAGETKLCRIHTGGARGVESCVLSWSFSNCFAAAEEASANSDKTYIPPVGSRENLVLTYTSSCTVIDSPSPALSNLAVVNTSHRAVGASTNNPKARDIYYNSLEHGRPSIDSKLGACGAEYAAVMDVKPNNNFDCKTAIENAKKFHEEIVDWLYNSDLAHVKADRAAGIIGGPAPNNQSDLDRNKLHRDMSSSWCDLKGAEYTGVTKWTFLTQKAYIEGGYNGTCNEPTAIDYILRLIWVGVSGCKSVVSELYDPITNLTIPNPDAEKAAAEKAAQDLAAQEQLKEFNGLCKQWGWDLYTGNGNYPDQYDCACGSGRERVLAENGTTVCGAPYQPEN